MKTCRIGIIGAGRIGKVHAENICHSLPQFHLLAIADPCLDLNWAQAMGITMMTTHWQEMIQYPELDAVLIASPSNLHAEQIIAASSARKAIFCEKPLGLTEEEILACLTVIEDHKTLLQVGFNRRFDPSFASMQDRIQAGEIGAPHLLRITSREPFCPSKEYIKSSGGLFMDMTTHDFDIARFLLNNEITEVYASGAILINPEITEFDDVDTAIIQIRFQNGALGVIDNSRQAIYGYDQRIEVFGSNGTLIANNHGQHLVEHWTQNEVRSAPPSYFFLERYQAAYLAELQAFYHAWQFGKESQVSVLDGLQALRLAKAAKLSLDSRQPISVPLTSFGIQQYRLEASLARF